MTDPFPVPASRTIVRSGVAAWLRNHADIAVRLVVAPPGFGKTTALAAYARTASNRRRVCFSLDGRTTSAALAASIGRALGDEWDGTLAGLGERLVATAPVEIVFDDMHLAGEELLAALNALVASAPAGVFFIVASQRRDIFAVGTLFARGFVAVCDQSDLAFDASDGRALFAAYGAAPAPAAIDALVAHTEGWPAAMAGTAREFACEPQTLKAAYGRWLGRSAVPALDLIATLLERVPVAERAVAMQHFKDGSALNQHTLAVLHRCGFFVRFEAGVFALMRWVDALYPATRAEYEELPPFVVQLFGRFAASIAGVPIVWARRRDQHIVQYLLLHPEAAASRATLANLFWPQTARPRALQNLRTACSTIRRAIGNVVGMEQVDAYFTTGEHLAFNRAALACDVESFRRHVAAAQSDATGVSSVRTIAHLRAAERLYGNGLFAGEAGDPIFTHAAREFALVYARVLERLRDALIERGSADLARSYATKALRVGYLLRGKSDGATTLGDVFELQPIAQRERVTLGDAGSEFECRYGA